VPVAIAVAVALAAAAVLVFVAYRRRDLGTSAERATFDTLHTANLAAPPLRGGLTETSAARSARHLRALLGTPAIVLTDTERTLAWEGPGLRHRDRLLAGARRTLSLGRPVVLHADDLACGSPDCFVQAAVVVPISVEDRVVGTLAAVTSTDSATDPTSSLKSTVMRPSALSTLPVRTADLNPESSDLTV